MKTLSLSLLFTFFAANFVFGQARHVTLTSEGPSSGISALSTGQYIPIPWDGQEIQYDIGLPIYATRIPVNLSGVDRGRLSANIYFPTGTGVLVAEYSVDDGSTWQSLGSSVSITGNGTKVGEWGSIPAGAKGDVILRIVTSSGSGDFVPWSISMDFD